MLYSKWRHALHMCNFTYSKCMSISCGLFHLSISSFFSVCAQRTPLCRKSPARGNLQHVNITNSYYQTCWTVLYSACIIWYVTWLDSKLLSQAVGCWVHSSRCSAGFLQRFVMHGISCCIKILVIYEIYFLHTISWFCHSLPLPRAGTVGTAKPIRRETRSSTSNVSACIHQTHTHIQQYIYKHTGRDISITEYSTGRIPSNPLAPAGMTVWSQFSCFEP